MNNFFLCLTQKLNWYELQEWDVCDESMCKVCRLHRVSLAKGDYIFLALTKCEIPNLGTSPKVHAAWELGE